MFIGSFGDQGFIYFCFRIMNAGQDDYVSPGTEIIRTVYEGVLCGSGVGTGENEGVSFEEWN